MRQVHVDAQRLRAACAGAAGTGERPGIATPPGSLGGTIIRLLLVLATIPRSALPQGSLRDSELLGSALAHAAFVEPFHAAKSSDCQTCHSCGYLKYNVGQLTSLINYDF